MVWLRRAHHASPYILYLRENPCLSLSLSGAPFVAIEARREIGKLGRMGHGRVTTRNQKHCCPPRRNKSSVSGFHNIREPFSPYKLVGRYSFLAEL